MEHAMRLYPEHVNRSTAAQLLSLFVVSASIMYFSGIPETVQLLEWAQNPMVLVALFWTGCITTALTVHMENVALKTLTAAETTLIFSTEPLWGALCASAIIGEHLGISTVIGGALILGGCIFSNLEDSSGGGTHGKEEPRSLDGGSFNQETQRVSGLGETLV
jgi:drug/metabolite transporter (DMT)-like permease